MRYSRLIVTGFLMCSFIIDSFNVRSGLLGRFLSEIVFKFQRLLPVSKILRVLSRLDIFKADRPREC